MGRAHEIALDSTSKIKTDFDRIAILSECDDEVCGNYDSYLLKFVPSGCGRALEIGCGTGTFTRRLAGLAGLVSGIDLSSEMIRVAENRSRNHANIDYQTGDIVRMDLADREFDCVVMIATLHHLPAQAVLEKLKVSLKPGGVLILHDLLRPDGTLDMLAELIRQPLSVSLRWFRTGRFWPRPEVRRAWAEHGKHERYLTRREVRELTDNFLPRAEVKYHFLWRYTVVWRRWE